MASGVFSCSANQTSVSLKLKGVVQKSTYSPSCSDSPWTHCCTLPSTTSVIKPRNRLVIHSSVGKYFAMSGLRLWSVRYTKGANTETSDKMRTLQYQSMCKVGYRKQISSVAPEADPSSAILPYLHLTCLADRFASVMPIFLFVHSEPKQCETAASALPE